MRRITSLSLLLLLQVSVCLGQTSESPLRIFGYFQNSFNHQTGTAEDPEQNSFNLQQLNLFFQKDLAKNWRAFVNFEFLNNFSSIRQWGAGNLEEAWVRYRSNPRFSVKLGLMIPAFNNLNEIKNRTPILPYVVRPLVYETSFSEFIAVEEFTPARAFVQAYGFLPADEAKIDYAIYIGNSPNISTIADQAQSGIDTTDTFLVGARLGLRAADLKIGISATRDNANFFRGAEQILPREVPASKFIEVPRTRLGADFSFNSNRWIFEAELISVLYDDDTPEISIDKLFYYATFGFDLTDQLFAYASYWLTRQDFTAFREDAPNAPALVVAEVDVRVPTLGVSYRLNDRITFKGQFARVLIEEEVKRLQIRENNNLNFYSVAASIFF